MYFSIFSPFRILFTFCFKEHHKLTSWLSVAHEPQKNDARLLNFSKSMLVATIFKTSCCAELLLFYFSSWTWSSGRPMWIILKKVTLFCLNADFQRISQITTGILHHLFKLCILQSRPLLRPFPFHFKLFAFKLCFIISDKCLYCSSVTSERGWIYGA